MSVSLWRYTEACDHRPCVGDCDLCGYDDEPVWAEPFDLCGYEEEEDGDKS